MESSLQVPRLSGAPALPVSGCDAILPGDNHISTINKTHETRERDWRALGGEMWGGWLAGLDWELSWQSESGGQAQPDQSTANHHQFSLECLETGVVRHCQPQSDTTVVRSNSQLTAGHSFIPSFPPSLLPSLPRWIVIKMTIRQDLSPGPIKWSGQYFCVILYHPERLCSKYGV